MAWVCLFSCSGGCWGRGVEADVYGKEATFTLMAVLPGITRPSMENCHVFPVPPPIIF
ncbi:hypothetical protein ACRRTK_014548 [Alexandromys fortis]